MGQNTNTRRSRPNPLLLVGIVIVAIVAIALVIIISLPKKDSDDQSTEQSQSSLSDTFMDYAKAYLGEDIDFSSAYVRGRSYAVDEAIASENGKEFFEKAQTLLQKFDSMISETNLTLRSNMNLYRSLVNYVSIIGQTDFPTEESLLTDYLEKGEGTTLDEINILFVDLEATKYDNSAEIIENEKAYYRSLVETYAFYDEAGCIVEKKLDDQCLARKVSRNSLTTLANSNYEISQSRIKFDKIISDSKSILWMINRLVNGEAK